jgi:hypothetical protein
MPAGLEELEGVPSKVLGVRVSADLARWEQHLAQQERARRL